MAFTTATTAVTSYLHRRAARVLAHVKHKTSPSGWVLPMKTTTFTDEGTWSNIDSDVTPLERRTWSTWTVLGFWFSDALNAQGWEGAASIIAVGLTWLVGMLSLLRPSPRLIGVVGEKRSTVSSLAIPWSLFLWSSTEPLAPISTSISLWPRVLLSGSISHE
jgi:hypothetical protein